MKHMGLLLRRTRSHAATILTLRLLTTTRRAGWRHAVDDQSARRSAATARSATVRRKPNGYKTYRGEIRF